MPKKYTTETFIIKSSKIHDNKYDYSLVDYIGSYTKIKIICPIHGVFEQIPNNHLHHNGCSKCKSSENNKKWFEKFIIKCSRIHNNKYDYSLVNLINNKTKIKIICPTHGVFDQVPSEHLIGHGCSLCSKNKKITIEEFIKKSNKIHHNKYDYSLTEYKDIKTKIKIICDKHGIFEQSPNSHLKGSGCDMCGGSKRKTTSEFIQDALKVHRNKYDYSFSEYINSYTKIKIICKEHGLFEQQPKHHLTGCGCPFCFDSIDIKNKELYILYDKKCDLYKIGYSKNVYKRKRHIESEINSDLIIIETFKNMAVMENKIHKLYNEYRTKHPIIHHGYKEWFNLSDNIIADIHKLIT
jgi:hypothetical protein